MVPAEWGHHRAVAELLEVPLDEPASRNGSTLTPSLSSLEVVCQAQRSWDDDKYSSGQRFTVNVSRDTFLACLPRRPEPRPDIVIVFAFIDDKHLRQSAQKNVITYNWQMLFELREATHYCWLAINTWACEQNATQSEHGQLMLVRDTMIM